MKKRFLEAGHDAEAGREATTATDDDEESAMALWDKPIKLFLPG
jgi:hypothetical protein